MHMTKAEFDVETVAAYLANRPGQRIVYHRIAADCKMTAGRASIALSYLINHGTLPGLARVGRGAYQLDPPPPKIAEPPFTADEIRELLLTAGMLWDYDLITGRDLLPDTAQALLARAAGFWQEAVDADDPEHDEEDSK